MPSLEAAVPSASRFLGRDELLGGAAPFVVTRQFLGEVRVDGRDPEFSDDEKEEILEDLQQSAMNVIERKGATEWGPATGVAHMVEAVLRDTGEVLPASIKLDGEYGYEDTAFGVPVRLGENGVADVLEWELTDHEQDLLDDAAEKLADQYEKIS